MQWHYIALHCIRKKSATNSAGYQNTVHKDKFLIMAMEVANESNRSFAELWKAVQKDSIMEHR